MGISGLMWTGLAGLNSSSLSISTTGDNISNMNTIGFRGSRAEFTDVLNRTIMGVGELGGGSRASTIETLFHQGPIVASSRSSDMAINGNGFFVLKGNLNGMDGSYYTRAGSFKLDEGGYLSNSDGLRVQGYMASATGIPSTTLGDMRMNKVIPPNPTHDVSMEVNFDGNPNGTIIAAGFDVANAETSSSFSQSMEIFDSTGAKRQATMYFTRTANDTWSYNLVADGGDLDGGTAGTPTIITNGTLAFNTDGELQTHTVATNTVDFENTTPGQELVFNFEGSTNHALTSTADDSDESNINVLNQDGYSAGNYVDMEVEPDGTVNGRYDNGEELVIGRVALADFVAQTGLERVGSTMFKSTQDSGDALIGFAGSGGRGAIRGSSLEQSNVDLSEEFVKLITDQRAYQATSRTITTADELLTETVNLKR